VLQVDLSIVGVPCEPALSAIGGPGTGLVPELSSGASTKERFDRGYPLPDDCSSPSRLPFLHCRRFIPDKKNVSKSPYNFFNHVPQKRFGKCKKIIFSGNVLLVNLPENIPFLKKNYGLA
jgi:hypothetical protein